MKLGRNDLKILDDDGREVPKRPGRYAASERQNAYQAARAARAAKFAALCARYGHSDPAVIKRRCRDQPGRGKKGVTLREALRVPPAGTPEYEAWRKQRRRDSGKAWREKADRERIATEGEKQKRQAASRKVRGKKM